MIETMATRAESRMKSMGLRPVDLAKKIPGMTESAISQFFKGATKGLRPENLVDMADALECSIRWIVYGEDGSKKYESKKPVSHYVAEVMQTQTALNVRQLIDQLGEALDQCTTDSRAAVAGLLRLALCG